MEKQKDQKKIELHNVESLFLKKLCQIHRVRKYIGRCQGLGNGEAKRGLGELVLNRNRVSV